MSKRNGRPPLWRALCLALSFVLALSMVPSVGLVGVQTALAAGEVSYQKATVNGTTVTFTSDTAASYTSLVNGNGITRHQNTNIVNIWFRRITIAITVYTYAI